MSANESVVNNEVHNLKNTEEKKSKMNRGRNKEGMLEMNLDEKNLESIWKGREKGEVKKKESEERSPYYNSVF